MIASFRNDEIKQEKGEKKSIDSHVDTSCFDRVREQGHYHPNRHHEDFVTDRDVTAASILGQEVSLSNLICRHPTEGSVRASRIRRIGKYRRRTQASLSLSVSRCFTIFHGWSGTSAAKRPYLGVRGGSGPTSTPPWSTRILGLPRSMEKVETEEEKKKQDMQMKEVAREALRQTREDRLDREREEISVGREVPPDGEGSNGELEGDSILMAMTAGATILDLYVFP